MPKVKNRYLLVHEDGTLSTIKEVTESEDQAYIDDLVDIVDMYSRKLYEGDGNWAEFAE